MKTPSDEQLVAWLDNELGAEQRSLLEQAMADDALLNLRVQWLSRSNLPYQNAYDELAQQAPLERLQARLDAIPSPEKPGLSRRWFIGAAAAALFAGGVLADRAFLGWQATRSNHDSPPARSTESNRRPTSGHNAAPELESKAKSLKAASAHEQS
ncbi:hypothetical protein SAMN05216579_2375 [Pseudomonas granadensis]|nr:hypothetical protein SAMN05216579_2375 [Pseudomonas granadensis]